MASKITYVWKLKTYSLALPFSVSGQRLSIGAWIRRTRDAVDTQPPAPNLQNVDIYTYTPLPSERHIRILELHPGSGRDQLRGTLHPVSLDGILEFDSLSYVWGGIQQHDKIQVEDGQWLTIGVNLSQALYSLRDEKHSKMIWIDALCIDQQSMEEKSSQVPLMAEIYAVATSVLVWLGLPAAQSQLGLEILSYLAAGGKFDDNAPWNRLESHEVGDALRDVIERTYFHRLWVVQEAALARRIVIRMGHLHLEWEGGAPTRRFLARIKMAELSPSWQQSDLRDIDFRPLRELLEQSLATEARRKGVVEIPSLLDVVHSIRNRNVTDPRDRIYGVMSLVTPAQVAGLVPDYRMSWEQTYQQFYDLVERQIQEDPTMAMEDVRKEEPKDAALTGPGRAAPQFNLEPV